MESTGQLQNPFGQEIFNTPQAPKRKSRKRFYMLVGMILLIGLVFVGSRVLGKKEATTVLQVAPTPTEEVFPTDTPTPTPEPTGPVTPTAVPTQNPVDQTTGLDRSALNVSAENGSGEVGGASKLATTLRSFGYHVVSVGNADNFDYQNVTIQVKDSSSKYLPLLKKDLSTVYTVGSATSDLSASSSADAVVILGK